MQNSFGQVLHRLRHELGLFQAVVAQQLGTTQRHVSFLETGRSQPSRTMLGRLVTDLNLSAGQRASLFEASGFRNPYKQRNFGSTEVAQTLDMIENRLLAHWPFPAFVLDADWTILRLNRPAQAMFGAFRDPESGELNAFSIFLSDRFRDLVENWEEASTSLYFRLQTAPCIRRGSGKGSRRRERAACSTISARPSPRPATSRSTCR